MFKTRLICKATLPLFLLTLLSITAVSQTPRAPGKPTSASKAQVASKTRSDVTASDATFQMTAAQRQEQRKAAIMLLDKAPVLTSDDKLEKDEFITFTRAITFDTAKIENSKQAIAELEGVLASVGNTKATLRSEPKDNEVVYRRYVDNSAPWQSATTNTQVLVRPALYIFRCTNKKTGETKEKTQSCTGNCTVEFKF